ncbi:hypothetical protein [Ralstonia phage RP13]|nr:hypothetical protein [Ralstonia phage RP13]
MRQSLNRFKKIHERNSHDYRTAGQRFCDMYLQNHNEIPGLLNERDDDVAFGMIRKWLDAKDHKHGLPKQIGH